MEVALHPAYAGRFADRLLEPGDRFWFPQHPVQHGDAILDIDIDLVMREVDVAECLAENAVGQHLVARGLFWLVAEVTNLMRFAGNLGGGASLCPHDAAAGLPDGRRRTVDRDLSPPPAALWVGEVHQSGPAACTRGQQTPVSRRFGNARFLRFAASEHPGPVVNCVRAGHGVKPSCLDGHDCLER